MSKEVKNDQKSRKIDQKWTKRGQKVWQMGWRKSFKKDVNWVENDKKGQEGLKELKSSRKCLKGTKMGPHYVKKVQN